jgi:sugar fermentation stimulation protein A
VAAHQPAQNPAAPPTDLPTGTTVSPVDLWTTRQPGTYVLLIHLAVPATLEIGRLGRVTLPAGWYAYIGSALGGLGARISRHARQEKRPHWHIDRLLAAGRLVEVTARIGTARIECQTAATVVTWPGAILPVPRFGASDCRCQAHLVHFEAHPCLALGSDWLSANPPS